MSNFERYCLPSAPFERTYQIEKNYCIEKPDVHLTLEEITHITSEEMKATMEEAQDKIIKEMTDAESKSKAVKKKPRKNHSRANKSAMETV